MPECCWQPTRSPPCRGLAAAVEVAARKSQKRRPVRGRRRFHFDILPDSPAEEKHREFQQREPANDLTKRRTGIPWATKFLQSEQSVGIISPQATPPSATLIPCCW